MGTGNFFWKAVFLKLLYTQCCFQKSALLFAFLLFADETKSILKQTRLVLQTNKTADFTPKTIFALTAELTMGKLLRVEIFLSPQLLIVCFE